MGAPDGQVQCVICHCQGGCERSGERRRASSVLFGVEAKWAEAGAQFRRFHVIMTDVSLQVNSFTQESKPPLYLSHKVSGSRERLWKPGGSSACNVHC